MCLASRNRRCQSWKICRSVKARGSEEGISHVVVKFTLLREPKKTQNLQKSGVPDSINLVSLRSLAAEEERKLLGVPVVENKGQQVAPGVPSVMYPSLSPVGRLIPSRYCANSTKKVYHVLSN